MILNNCYYKVSMLLIYLDMIIISVVVIVGGADDDHVILCSNAMEYVTDLP